MRDLKLKCSKCGSIDNRFRVIDKTYLCRRCGHIWLTKDKTILTKTEDPVKTEDPAKIPGLLDWFKSNANRKLFMPPK